MELVQVFLFHLTIDTMPFGCIGKVYFTYIGYLGHDNISTSQILQKFLVSFSSSITTLKPFPLVLYFFPSSFFFFFLIIFLHSAKLVILAVQVFLQSYNITLIAFRIVLAGALQISLYPFLHKH